MDWILETIWVILIGFSSRNSESVNYQAKNLLRIVNLYNLEKMEHADILIEKKAIFVLSLL